MNIGRFFVDVRGTITTNNIPDIAEKENEITRAKKLISKLIEADGLDHMIISVISSDNIEVVEKVAMLLHDIFKDVPKVRLGYHHADGVKMHLGGKMIKDSSIKEEQMEEDLLLFKYDYCYYADDVKVNRLIAKRCLNKKFPEMKVVIFNPQKDELRGMNNSVEKYISSRLTV